MRSKTRLHNTPQDESLVMRFPVTSLSDPQDKTDIGFNDGDAWSVASHYRPCRRAEYEQTLAVAVDGSFSCLGIGVLFVWVHDFSRSPQPLVWSRRYPSIERDPKEGV